MQRDLPQHVQPLEIIHHTRSLDLLRGKSRTAVSVVAPLASAGTLRTLVAVLPEQLRAAEELVRRRYAWRRYQLPAATDCDGVAAASEGERVTLIAENRGMLLGTLTVRPGSALLAEKTYGAEIERLRREGHRLGEVVKLALEAGADWKIALDVLVRSAYLITHLVHALTDVMIEVNPRHVVFYERVLGFVVAATGRICSRVGAPSVLMRLDLEQFGHRVQSAAA